MHFKDEMALFFSSEMRRSKPKVLKLEAKLKKKQLRKNVMREADSLI